MHPGELPIRSLKELALDQGALDLGVYMLLTVLANPEPQEAYGAMPAVGRGELRANALRLSTVARMEWGELRDSLARLKLKGKILYSMTADGQTVHAKVVGYPEPDQEAEESPEIIDEFRGIPGYPILLTVNAKIQRAWLRTYGNRLWIAAEISKAHAWELANPRKAKKNKARFLTNWLSRAAKDGITTPPPPAQKGLTLAGRAIEE
jgi:hypothetical protein